MFPKQLKIKKDDDASSDFDDIEVPQMMQKARSLFLIKPQLTTLEATCFTIESGVTFNQKNYAGNVYNKDDEANVDQLLFEEILKSESSSSQTTMLK